MGSGFRFARRRSGPGSRSTHSARCSSRRETAGCGFERSHDLSKRALDRGNGAGASAPGSVGRAAAPDAPASGEESPGSMERRCRITSGGGDPRDSATESRPPQTGSSDLAGVRVKGCGKSAPRTRQRGRHGKPHREQDRIGAARPIPERGRAGLLSRPVARVGRSRRSATTVPEEWPPRPGARASGPYRTRLTGRLIHFFLGAQRFGASRACRGAGRQSRRRKPSVNRAGFRSLDAWRSARALTILRGP